MPSGKPPNHAEQPPFILEMLGWLAFPVATRKATLKRLSSEYRSTINRFERRWLANVDYIRLGLMILLRGHLKSAWALLSGWTGGNLMSRIMKVLYKSPREDGDDRRQE